MDAALTIPNEEEKKWSMKEVNLFVENGDVRVHPLCYKVAPDVLWEINRAHLRQGRVFVPGCTRARCAARGEVVGVS